MKGYVLLGFALAAVLALLVVALVPSVDDFSPDNPFWNGLSRFYSEFGAVPVDVRGFAGLPRGVAAVILAPSSGLDARSAAELRRFVEEGGLLVVADDFGAGNAVLELLGTSARFSGALLADGVFMYKSPFLPRALAEINGTRYELYLNYATTVEPGRSGVCLAASSPFSYLDLNMNGKRDGGEPSGPFCVVYAERVGRGVVFVVSDPSIFINAMVEMGDNKPMLRSILGGRMVFVVEGLREPSAYTVARAQIFAALSAIFASNLRYAVVLAVAAALYLAVLRAAARRMPAEAGRGGVVGSG